MFHFFTCSGNGFVPNRRQAITRWQSLGSVCRKLRRFLYSLQWRHNERDGVPNHQGIDCLLSRLFRCRSNKASKPRVPGLCEGNPPEIGGLSSQRASNAETLPIWWRREHKIMWSNHFNTEAHAHWGRVKHIWVSKLTIIGSDDGLSPGRRQAIIWTNAGILLIGTLGTKLNEILSEIHILSFMKMHLKTSSAKWLSFCLDLLTCVIQ